jgi:peptidyl-dipeptidase Dcp
LDSAQKNDDGDTREVLEQMARLRLQKANLMGKKEFC